MIAQFDHEKLEVYQLELQFITWTSSLLEEMRKHDDHSRIREVSDHLNRAGLSALLNTAEGNGKRQRQIRAKFFDDARGSATECAACLDALAAMGACDSNRTATGKEMLIRIVSMLTKLVQRFSENEAMVRESRAEYQRVGIVNTDFDGNEFPKKNSKIEDEDENEDEDDWEHQK